MRHWCARRPEMRPSFVLSSLILLCALSALAQNSQSTIEPAVQSVLQRQQEAWNRHDLESFMSGYWNSPELTFFSGAKISSGWQATIARYREVSERRPRYGQVGVLRFEYRSPLVRLGICARIMALNHVRRKDAARIVHSHFPEISRWLEDHSRSHVSRGVS
jgi:hypothetical protein